jgi:hypothetical protein
MLVTFNPMINTGASADAAYMNFLRCVRAICTAAAGTSSITVNPFTNNTGTIDNTRNCIVSIDANAEAGGWTESTASNVIQSGSFTAMNSAGAAFYKFDAYNASNKGTYPYNKLSFHGPTHTSYGGSYYASGQMYGGNVNTFSTYPFIRMTFGCSSATDWSASSQYAPSDNTYPNYYQLTSWTMNDVGSTSSNQPQYGHPAFWSNNAQVNYRIAVTATYCIIWEVHTSNSYANGYSNYFTVLPSSYNNTQCYGGLMYGGLRETVLWENSRSDNPPWVAMQVYHVNSGYTSQSTSTPTPANSVCAFMATLDGSGLPVATGAQRYWINNYYAGAEGCFARNIDERSNPTAAPGNFSLTSGYLTSPQQPQGIVMGPFISNDSYNGGPSSSSIYMPTVDAATATGVPSAYPIVVRRNNGTSWNPGGAIRGIYKSLGMTQSLMKNYFSAGQTYSIYNSVLGVTDTYIPVVFNYTMYLIRYA